VIFGAQNMGLLGGAFAIAYLMPRWTMCAVEAVGEVINKGTAWRFAGFHMARLTYMLILMLLGLCRLKPLPVLRL
jgi:hypothetical protein